MRDNIEITLTRIERFNNGKEKFDRSKEHANIGTIGHVDHGLNAIATVLAKMVTL